MGPRKHDKRPLPSSATRASRRYHEEGSAAQPTAAAAAPPAQPVSTMLNAPVDTVTVAQPAGTQLPALQDGAAPHPAAPSLTGPATAAATAAAPAPTTIPPTPCGFTQERLIALIDKASSTPAQYPFVTPDPCGDGSFVVPSTRTDVNKHVRAMTFSDNAPRCAACGHTIDEHRSESDARGLRGWRIQVNLEGWRRVYRLRRRVTELARRCAARGTVTPSGFNIDLNLWFSQVNQAALFESELTSAGRFFFRDEDLTIPGYFFEDARADGELFVAPYARVDDDGPDKTPSHTSSINATGAGRRAELCNYQRIMDLLDEEVQEVHLVPKALLGGDLPGTWMSVVADSTFNAWTDMPISPVDIDIAREGDARADGRTPVELRISFRNNEPERWNNLLHKVVKEAQIGPGQSLRVPISLRSDDLPRFRAVIAWRKATVAAAIDKDQRGFRVTNNRRTSAWYNLIPLTKYPELRDFAARPNSPQEPESETLRRCSWSYSSNNEYDSSGNDEGLDCTCWCSPLVPQQS